MSLLLYKSSEMFSSTELIRKSKTIFNKIINNEIEKAIIMRDGKPGFLLMDFSKYEEIMAEFEMLKKSILSSNEVASTPPKKVIADKEVEVLEEATTSSIVQEKVKSSHVVPPRPKAIEKEIIIEDSVDEDLVIEEDETEELTEEQEISNAIKSISSMNFSDDMKAMATQKIKEKIQKARKERAALLLEQAKEEKNDLKEELEIQVHIKEENKKKAEELKEFWD